MLLLYCVQINHSLTLSMCSPLLNFSIFQSFYYLMSPFSHLSLDSKTISSISFHYHSPELVHKNSNSGHFDHLPSLNYICTTETYRYKNHKTKLSEFCLHVRITQGAFKKKKKYFCPKQLNQHLQVETGTMYFLKFPQVILL